MTQPGPISNEPLVSIPGAFAPGARLSETVRLCIYGNGGTGKTTLLGTMPGRGLVVDIPQIEGGDFVLSNHAGRIDILRIEGWLRQPADPQTGQPEKWGLQDVWDWLAYTQHQYKWIAIDSLTAMTELAIRKIIKERPSILNLDPHKVTQPEWGSIGRLVSEMVYQFHKLPLHIIWTAQERGYGGESQPVPFIGPSTTPAAVAALIPPLLLCGRLSVPEGSKDRWLQLGPGGKFKTKIRTKAGRNMPDIVLNPNLATILRYALGPDDAVRPEEVANIPVAEQPVFTVLS